MHALGRVFFGLGLLCFIISGLLWSSLYGVIAWRAGVALMLTGIGMAVLWPEEVPKVGKAFFLGVIHLLTVIFALSIYLLGEGMGMAAVLLLTVVSPLLILLLVGFQIIKKKETVAPVDQLLPLVSLILFLLPFWLQTTGLLERIPLSLLTWIGYCGFVLLGGVIYRLFRALPSKNRNSR